MATSAAVRQRSPAPAAVTRPWLTIASLVFIDSVALLTSVLLSVCIKSLVVGNLKWEAYFRLGPLLLVFLVVYAAIGMYSVVALSPPEELRRGTFASAVLFLFLATSTTSLRGARQEVTWTLLLSLALSVMLLPILRALLRSRLAGRPWWGHSAVLFGAGPAGEHVLDSVLNDPAIGLKPVAVIDELAGPGDLRGVPVYRHLEHMGQLPQPAYAVFSAADFAPAQLQRLIERHSNSFSYILVLPDFRGLSSFWVQSRNLAGMAGLEIAQTRGHESSKRLLDCVLALLVGLVAFPLMALIALLIRLDSPGPVFYGQRRIGRHGCRFTAWKFRTMNANGDVVLARLLRESPLAAQEWSATQKLKHDPRVTRLGRFLRRTSLDELPQIWNVLSGQMSFVGPRPIVDSEVVHYGADFELYKRVLGGITGLWQVSGRSDTTYAERVSLDAYYARNWSVWLDLCILFRTIPVVLFGKGAY